jgi:F-type H+-transporting ATPase subunit a
MFSGSQDHDPMKEVQDQIGHWHFFDPKGLFDSGFELHLPVVDLGFVQIPISKFKILLLFVAILIAGVYIPLCKKVAKGEIVRGPFWNAFESLLTYIRNEVAKPTLGDLADKYVPFLWTLFLFVLFANLFGMLPFMGSPTANISVTAALALISCFMINLTGINKCGPVGYLKGFWMKIDLPIVGPVVSAFLYVLEFGGIFIRSAVLSVRLFANMFAGHMVLATVLLFAVKVAGSHIVLQTGVTAISLVAAIALSILELLVAFLQAYVFTFLTALFMGMATHAGHDHDEHHSHDENPATTGH